MQTRMITTNKNNFILLNFKFTISSAKIKRNETMSSSKIILKSYSYQKIFVNSLLKFQREFVFLQIWIFKRLKMKSTAMIRHDAIVLVVFSDAHDSEKIASLKIFNKIIIFSQKIWTFVSAKTLLCSNFGVVVNFPISLKISSPFSVESFPKKSSTRVQKSFLLINPFSLHFGRSIKMELICSFLAIKNSEEVILKSDSGIARARGFQIVKSLVKFWYRN